jgi:large subunit ribosomal protein L22
LKPEDHDLYVKEAFVDQGVTIKRFLPAPQGRANRLRKRSNHITIKVDSKTPVEFASAAEEKA